MSKAPERKKVDPKKGIEFTFDGYYNGTVEGFFYCRYCEEEYELEGELNAWKTIAIVECPGGHGELYLDGDWNPVYDALTDDSRYEWQRDQRG
jgi:hypothetical protein